MAKKAMYHISDAAGRKIVDLQQFWSLPEFRLNVSCIHSGKNTPHCHKS
jgi:hypothetical protein